MPTFLTIYITFSSLFVILFCRCAGWASRKEDEEDKAMTEFFLNDLANGNK
jgi:hypothetical protein